MAKSISQISVDIVLSGGKLPTYATPDAAGADLYACIDEDILLYPGHWRNVPLKFSTSIPTGYAALITPRSGRARDEGLSVLNSPGLIDSDYRGEWGALIFNHGSTPIYIRNGERIAQAIFIQVVTPKFNVVESIQATERDKGGFGHSGK